MNKVVVAVIAVIIVGFGIFAVVRMNHASSSNPPATNTTTNNTPSQTSTNNSDSSGGAAQKFSDSPDAQYAYLIAPGPLSAQAKQATAGFTITSTTQADGSLLVNLEAMKAGYISQKYTVKQGEKLYFIEQSLGDDQAPDTDETPTDDTAVLVDANGNIVQ